MKKFKKLVALVLVGVMAMAMLTACGGGGTSIVNYEERAKSAIVTAVNGVAPNGTTLTATEAYNNKAASILENVDKEGNVYGTNHKMTMTSGYTEPVDKETLQIVFYYDLQKIITKASNENNAENLADIKTIETLKQRDEFNPEKVKKAIQEDKALYSEIIRLVRKTQPAVNILIVDNVTYETVGSAVKITDDGNCYGAYAVNMKIEITGKV